MQLGQQIKKLRVMKGYSQEYMAIQLEISQKTYCRYESDPTKISVLMLTNIAQILEVHVTDLFTCELRKQSLSISHDISGHNTIQQHYKQYLTSLDEYVKREKELISLLVANNKA